MSNRVTIMLDDSLSGKLQKLRGQAIANSEFNISFSDVLNYAIHHAFDKGGYNVNKIIHYKENLVRN